MSDAKLFGLKPLQGDEKFISLLPKLGLGIEEIKPKIWPPLTRKGTWPLEHIKIVYNQNMYDGGKGIQGCTGYAGSELDTIHWYLEALKAKPRREQPRTLYDVQLFCGWWLYHQAQNDDPDPLTTPEADNGAYMFYLLEVMKNKGNVPIKYGYPIQAEEQMMPNRRFCIESFLLCTGLEQIRAGLSEGPMLAGIPYHDDFLWPRPREVTIDGIARTEYWIGAQDDWGGIPGYHAICLCGGDDEREGVLKVGTWGLAYPMVWLPYRGRRGTGGVERLIQEGGEFYAVKFREQ